MPLNEELSEDPIVISESQQTAIDTQRLHHRESAFQTAQVACLCLYILFFGVLMGCVLDTDLRAILAAPPHMNALPIALLLVPSFLLWGMVRAAFKVESDEKSLCSVAKMATHETLHTAKGSHPLI